MLVRTDWYTAANALLNSSEYQYVADHNTCNCSRSRPRGGHLNSVESRTGAVTSGREGNCYRRLSPQRRWLMANRLHPVLLRPLPGTRATSLHLSYPASTVLRTFARHTWTHTLGSGKTHFESPLCQLEHQSLQSGPVEMGPHRARKYMERGPDLSICPPGS